jgi:hypothetical protein
MGGYGIAFFWYRTNSSPPHLLVDLGQEPVVRIVLVFVILHCDVLMVCAQRTRGP